VSYITPARLILPVLFGMLSIMPAAGQPAERQLFSEEWRDGWIPSDFSRPGEVVFTDTAVVLHAGDPMTGIT